MKRNLIAALIGIGMTLSAQADPLRVVTSTRDLADFVQHVGGSHVAVKALVSGMEDPHNVLMKPSMIMMLARADLFIEMGLDMEHAYVPALVAESRNNAIQIGKPGFLDASHGMMVLEVPRSMDRSEGDVHPMGNPHWNLDPIRAKQAIQTIADRLAELDPAHAGEYKANTDRYFAELDAKIAQWRARLEGNAIRFVSYHPHFVYFADRFGLKEIGTIQPKAGIEPGPQAIANLIQRMQVEKANLVIRESFFSDRFPRQVAERAGARLAVAPIQVGALPGADNYIAMMDMLVAAFAGE